MPPSRSRKPLGPLSGPAGVIAYYRVSTEQQGRSGLGLEAQKAAVAKHVAATGSRLIEEYEEVESGKRSDRPQLAKALAACRARRATLIIAKLDRLARNTRFLLNVVEGCGEGGVLFCDLPQIPTGAVGKFLVTLLAAVAELEAGLISQRTKAALAAARARGVKLGGRNLHRGADAAVARSGRDAQTARARAHACDVLPYIEAARRAGACSLRQLAAALTARGVPPPSGGEAWNPEQIRRLLKAATSA
jgi:DNA invertase Pin-like site-specific DNA recombinase